MRSKHIVLVIHGSRADYTEVRHLVDWVRQKGHFVEPWVTYEPGDAAALVADAARRGVDVVFPVAGDGTLNEGENGLDGYDGPLGLISQGAAIDFALQEGSR